MAVTVTTMKKMKREGDKITWLTAYDYSFASLIDEAGVDAILVGDSLGMVMQGHPTPIPVTIEDSVYHTECVARGASNAMVVGDLPFGSYQLNKEQAYANAVKLMQAGAQFLLTDRFGLTLDFNSIEVEDGDLAAQFDTTSIGVRFSF